MPLKEPAADQNVDNDESDQPFDFELGENDQPSDENDQTEGDKQLDADALIASPRRSARLANIDGETPCNDMIPTVSEYFPKKVQNEENTGFDEDEEYNIDGEKTKYSKEDYIGDRFDESEFEEGQFVTGNLNGRSVQNNTSKNYANFLFQNEKKGKVQINELSSNKHLHTFTNHLINKVYPKYGINKSIMSKSTTGNSWRPDLAKMADNGIKKLPLWFDIDVKRTREGLPQSQTQRQKEALGFNAVCHHCSWRLGTTRGGMTLVIKDLEFDGVSEEHQKIKYNGQQAPKGTMQAMGEVALGRAVLCCNHCHRARGNDFEMWKNN